ncbi:MAG TPA: urate hydroxylase PuuD, partial [Acidimicrobiales bacterium]|nr:urate hydroxylase PuuD [Acidimicrobiales bacterium]
MDILDQIGLEGLSRWGHYLAGVTWIGLLYYFNFVQTPAFTEVSDATRSEAMRTVTWRALWWFRFGALLTLLTGLLILGFGEKLGGDQTDGYWTSPAGLGILMGIILGVTMFLNVWLVIWPGQQVVIGSARKVAEGGEADPNAAAAAKRAARASRTNTLFSIPLLFFMAFPSHISPVLDTQGEIDGGEYWLALVIFLVVWAVLELSALGRIGGYDGP